MKIWKIVPLLLVLVLLFCGCRKDDVDADESGTGDTQPAVELDISGYTVIYAMTSTDDVKDEVRSMVSTVKEATGTKLEMKSDNLIDDSIKSYESPDAEILIGLTNRVESIAVAEELESGLSYIIRQMGNKVVICAKTDEALIQAIKDFSAMIEQKKALKIDENYNFVGKFEMSVGSDEYTLVFAGANRYNEQIVAETLAAELTKYSPSEIKAKRDVSTAETDKEILIGLTKRSASIEAQKDVGYYEYKIAVKSGKVILVAGSEVALEWGAQALLDSFKTNSLDLTKDSEKVVGYELERVFSAESVENFEPSWLSDYTPASWLSNVDGRNFMEKAYALTTTTSANFDGTRPLNNGTTRITSQIHRGDVVHYPEGSLESIASAIWMGVDVMELDIQKTKDGIMILSHDETLNRMTNVSEFVGKKGYPNSTKIADWTYAQICDLSMKSGLGNNNPATVETVITEYKVPSLYEALELCAGKIFVQIDDKNAGVDCYPYGWLNIAHATDSKECFLSELEGSARGRNGAQHGNMLSTLKVWAKLTPEDTDFAEFVATLQTWTDDNGALIRGEPYWPNPTSNYCGWTYHTYLKENSSTWGTMVSKGYYHMWTEDPLALIKYIESNCAAVTLPS